MNLPNESEPLAIPGLSAEQSEAVRAVLRDCKAVRCAVLFGSRALGRHRPGSDIDIALLGDIDQRTLHTLIHALDDLLLPWVFDLAVYRDIENPRLREHIDRVGLTLYTASSP